MSQLGSNRRLKTIYWANTRTAHGAGKWTRIQRTKAALPFLLYRLGQASEHRPHHAARENTILPVDHAFWDTWYPPNGWGCVCWIRQITEAEAERLGGVSDPPDIETVPWTNKRTGETRQIPQGIDPGWDTNPGKTRHRTLARHLAGHLDAAPDEIRRAAMVDLVRSQMFRRVQGGALSGRKVFAPVAVIPKEAVDALGARTRIAFLSPETAAKQIRKRDGLDGLGLAPDDYLKVQRLLDTGGIFETRPLHFVAHGLIDGLGWMAAFKTTRNREEVFLLSFRRTNEKEARKWSEKSYRTIRDGL